MPTENLPALPDAWPDGFAEDERDYLYVESRRRLLETMEFGNQQEAKALALVRISLLVFAASGIFGDLRVEMASPSPLDWSLITQASVLAIAASGIVGALAIWLLHPQEWETGINVGWLARWSGASTREMRDASLEVLVEGFDKNAAITRKRGDRLTWLLWALALQTLCVVFVELAANAPR